MKKIFTLLLAVGVLSSAFAQWRNNGNDDRNNNGQYGNNQNNNYQNSSLVVNAYSQNGFTVSIDNGNTSQSNGNSIQFRSIASGSHLVTVSAYRSTILGKQVPRVIYNSNISFRPGVETTLNIDNNGAVNITERQLSGNGNNGNYNNGRDNDNRANNGKGNKYKKNKYPHDNRNHDKQKHREHDDDDRNDRKDD